MKTIRTFIIFSMLVSVLFLVGCGGTPEPTPAAPPPTAVVEAPPTEPPTAVPTEEPTAAPTEEPTAVPTEEPTAVPTEEPEPELVEAMPAFPGDVFVRAIYSGDEIALRFSWVSTKVYAGQFHDFVRFDGEAWDRLPSAERIEEDRVSIMIEDPNIPNEWFPTTGCYAGCHSDMNTMPDQPVGADGNVVDTRHYFLASEEAPAGGFAVDMWHWRGGRSGPMGYAEDTWVRYGERDTGEQGRRRDNAGAAPTNWVRADGDRFYEDQNWGGDLMWNDVMLPRFVFNPEKSGFNNYFLADSDGNAFTTPQQVLDGVRDINFVSQLIIFQDLAFDPVDKVNAIDIMYLLYMAGAMDEPEDFRGDWAAYWAEQTGVEDAEGAAAMLDGIVSAMAEGVMVTRSVGFIYDSSQHEIRSTRDFDYDNGIWTVTMYRSLTTPLAGSEDVDLSGLEGGVRYNMAFAMHDIGKGGKTHFISFPYTLGSADSDANVKAMMVDNVWDAEWAAIEPFYTVVYSPDAMIAIEFLLNKEQHEGADSMDIFKCQRCHTIDFEEGLGVVED
jgi:hypothetical protein